MEVHVQTSISIARPRGEVAAFAADPNHATDWYKNINAIEWKTQPPLREGSRIEFRARFLGRTLVYTYEVGEYLPGERLVMSAADGPFPMETTYTWSDADGGTTMVITNRGRPAGFARIATPAIERSMRRANLADLRRLKEILEQAAR